MPLPPQKPPTHAVLDLDVVWDLGDRIDEEVTDGVLTPERLRAIAEAAGEPAAHAWVAAGADPDLEWRREHQVAIEVCTGGCQGWGAVSIVERLLALQAVRAEAGGAGFDVIARGCLDACDRPPVVAVSGPEGRFVHTDASAEALEALIAGSGEV